MKKSILSLFAILLLIGCSKENSEVSKSITVAVSVDKTLYNGVETLITAAPTGSVSEVVFYFEGQSIGSSISSPYSVKFTPENIKPGSYTVSCVAKNSNNTYKGDVSVNVVLRLGDEFEGGKIFYLNSPGDHGLISSKTDLTYSGEFGDETLFSWGAESLLGTENSNGKNNTKLMSESAPSSGYAGFLFKNGGFSQNGFSDWYIPSIEELELLKENKKYVGGFSNNTDWEAMYWSSSESNEKEAFILNFNALMGNTNNKTRAFKIRPIRSF